MAKRVREELVDDFDGTEIPDGKGETVSFAYRGTSYEIDLHAKHAKEFDDLIGQYIAVARKAGRTTATRGRAAKGDRGYDISELRGWAAKKGIDVPARGRIPQAVVDQFLGK